MLNDLQELYNEREKLLKQGLGFIKKRKTKRLKRINEKLKNIYTEIIKREKDNVKI